jgi:transcriptional regulator with PAS, ATPase and Fis domain
MRDLEQTILKVAPTEATVLIEGETGTGKDLVARALHHHSPRREQPFVTINCSAIPEQLLESQLFGHVRGAFTGASRDHAGLFETAGRGTIFLDEIGEMPLALQPKVLRAVEARELTPLGSTSPVAIAARIVAATHRDLRNMSESGQFRKDLYYRLSTIEIAIPPLRTRPEDVEPIARHLLDRFAGNTGRRAPILTPAARALLESYEWPGNVRELANLLERALILNLGSTIDAKDFPKILTPISIPPTGDLRRAREAFERLFIQRVIGLSGGDKVQAAKVLGIGIASLYRKLGSASASPKPSNGQPRRSSKH